MWSFLLSSYCIDLGRKIALFHSYAASEADWQEVGLPYLSVWGDGVVAGPAGFFVQSCGLGWSWLGCDFGRSEHFPLVLHHLRPRSSSFSLSYAVPPDGGCSSFILQLLLASDRLHLPHSPLFIPDAQHLHEVQLHLLVAGRKSANSRVCLCGRHVMRDGSVFFIPGGWKGCVSTADQVSVWKPLQLLSVFEDGCCSRDSTADVFILDFLCMVSFFFSFLNPCIWKHTNDTLPQGKGVKNSPSLLLNARPKTGLFLILKCLNKHAWAHKQSFGFSRTKTMTNTSVKSVSATCWAPGSSPERCVSLACCRWAIPWNHPQGRRCCWSPSPSSSSPSRPPLHPPSSTDGSGCTAGAKQRKKQGQELRKMNIYIYIYVPKSPPATLVVGNKDCATNGQMEPVFLVHQQIMSWVPALLFILYQI